MALRHGHGIATSRNTKVKEIQQRKSRAQNQHVRADRDRTSSAVQRQWRSNNRYGGGVGHSRSNASSPGGGVCSGGGGGGSRVVGGNGRGSGGGGDGKGNATRDDGTLAADGRLPTGEPTSCHCLCLCPCPCPCRCCCGGFSIDPLRRRGTWSGSVPGTRRSGERGDGRSES